MLIKPSAALRNDSVGISELAKLRTRVTQAEEERLHGAKTLSVEEARQKLQGRVNEI